MQETVYHIRNRRIDSSDLETIRQFIDSHWARGRTFISRRLCEHWNWRQPNGLIKDQACRALLLKLEQKGEIRLPPPLTKCRVWNKRKAPSPSDFSYDQSPMTGSLSRFTDLKLEMARWSPLEKMWGDLISTYHYLGRPSIVGAYLKYIAYIDDRPVACLGWGGAAWKVACRDAMIGWDPETRKKNLHMVVNNVRFLILPWVRIKNLASRLLSANI
ncbi:MAG: Druantia anti-phage system protein DruA, partial [Desulfobacterales bacterium]